MTGAAPRRGPPGLRALLRLREQICRFREAELGRGTEAVSRAGAALAEAEQRCLAQRSSLQTERGRELPPGAPASQHQRQQRWLGRLEAELAALEVRRASAVSDLAARRQALDTARQSLFQAHAELQAAERAWQAWDRARRSAEQRRAEEELADLVEARRRARR